MQQSIWLEPASKPLWAAIGCEVRGSVLSAMTTDFSLNFAMKSVLKTVLQRGDYNEKTRLYADRIAGGDFDHCVADGHLDAGVEPGPQAR